MSKAFSARFSIQGSISTGNPGEYDTFGDVVDSSLDGYDINDIQVGDLVYDENVLTGEHTRWKVTNIVALGPGSIFGSGGASACHLVVTFDDGGLDPGGPVAGTGAICRSTSNFLSEIPSQSTKGISESLANRIRNIDSRVVIDPGLNGGGGGGSGKSLENTYQNNSGSNIGILVPVRSDSGNINTVSVSSESQVSEILGITKAAIGNGNSGVVFLAGLIENISSSIALDTPVYLSKTGTITDIIPDIGVGGFVSGDFVVKLGQIVRNSDTPSNKDLKVDIEIIGQL